MIEHVLDPVKFTNNLVNTLKDSILVIETPSIERIIEFSKQEKCVINILITLKILQILFKNFIIIKSYIDLGRSYFNNEKNYHKQIKNHNINNQNTNESKNFKVFLKKIDLRKKYFNKFFLKNKSKKTWLYGASTSIYDLFNIYDFSNKKLEGILDTDRKNKKYALQFDNKINSFSL